MRFRAGAVLVLVSLVLSGCFVGNAPLIPVEQVTFPYQRIVYKEGVDGQEIAITINPGYEFYDTLTGPGSTSAAKMVFLEIAPNSYLTQMGTGPELVNVPPYRYFLTVLDPVEMKAYLYAQTVGDNDFRPGVEMCRGFLACPTDLEALKGLFLERLASGEEPTAEFIITVLE